MNTPSMHPESRVFVVDDDISIRESVEHLLRNAGFHVEVFASAREFLARPRVLAPSCLVLDVSLPDLNGLELQKHLRDCPALPIIFITGYGDIPTSVRAMKAGAVDFLTKPLEAEVFLTTVQNAVARSTADLAGELELSALRERYACLSDREREVMALVISGLLNKQAGAELGISEITVKAHRGRVMRKMRAESFADLVQIANKLGLAPSAKI